MAVVWATSWKEGVLPSGSVRGGSGEASGWSGCGCCSTAEEGGVVVVGGGLHCPLFGEGEGKENNSVQKLRDVWLLGRCGLKEERRGEIPSYLNAREGWRMCIHCRRTCIHSYMCRGRYLELVRRSRRHTGTLDRTY